MTIPAADLALLKAVHGGKQGRCHICNRFQRFSTAYGWICPKAWEAEPGVWEHD